ncbi:MAG: hypothetical protein RIT43_1555 [Bacteroidota bacterium]|jgi:hypothetical protein
MRFKLILGSVFLILGNTFANPIEILFIGNSFTHMNQMPKTFEKVATSLGQNVYVEMNAKSNHSLKMHTERPELFTAIRSRKWDFVIIQPFSRELIFREDSVERATIPYLKQLLDSVYANNACTNVLLYQTWGYKNGTTEDSLSNTYDRMSNRIREGAMRISDRFGLPVVPVGMVWDQVLKLGYGTGLYDADGSHPSPEGSYLIASTFYVALFKKELKDAFTAGIAPEKVAAIQKTAYDFVLTNVDEYKLRKDSYVVFKVFSKQAKAKILCKAYFSDADSLKWDFGDGKRSTDSIVEHSFADYGKYTVKLTVYEECGIREYLSPVEFVRPQKPKKKK